MLGLPHPFEGASCTPSGCVCVCRLGMGGHTLASAGEGACSGVQALVYQVRDFLLPLIYLTVFVNTYRLRNHRSFLPNTSSRLRDRSCQTQKRTSHPRLCCSGVFQGLDRGRTGVRSFRGRISLALWLDETHRHMRGVVETLRTRQHTAVDGREVMLEFD